VEEASEAGTIPQGAGEIVSRALELPDLTAADVMVPRQSVVMISRRAPREELKRLLLEHKFSRLPVFESSFDNIVGYVTIKDVIALAWEKELIVLEDLIRPPYFVPESKGVVELMNEMRDRRQPFAVVVDEHGGMSGIVTMEDLCEELVGEIFSEHVRATPDEIKRQPDGSAIVSGTTPIREINRALDIELPEDSGFSTIAGLCLSLAGRVPTVGQVVEVPGVLVIEALDASARRIRALRIRLAEKKNPSEPAGNSRRP
jgi:putative hemolysin